MARKPTTSTSKKRRPGAAEAPTRRKECPYCAEKIDHIDYKNHEEIRRFMSEKGKIRSGRVTGVCRRHQNQLASAIKRAREVALVPYATQ